MSARHRVWEPGPHRGHVADGPAGPEQPPRSLRLQGLDRRSDGGRVDEPLPVELDNLFSRSCRLVLRIRGRWASGKVAWTSRSASASISSSAPRREASVQALRQPAPLLGRRVLIGLPEDAPDRRGHHAQGATWQDRLGIAREPAASSRPDDLALAGGRHPDRDEGAIDNDEGNAWALSWAGSSSAAWPASGLVISGANRTTRPPSRTLK